MPRQMVVDFLAGQRLVPGQGGIQNLLVVLDIARDEIEGPVLDHQLLAKPAINLMVRVAQGLRSAGRNQGLVKLPLGIEPQINKGVPIGRRLQAHLKMAELVMGGRQASLPRNATQTDRHDGALGLKQDTQMGQLVQNLRRLFRHPKPALLTKFDQTHGREAKQDLADGAG